MPRGRLGHSSRTGPGDTDPSLGEQGGKAPVRSVSGGPIDLSQGQEDFRFNPSQPSRKFEPDAAPIIRGTPVGAAGVKFYHSFPHNMVFAVDDEPKFIPAPTVTQSVRRSLFQQFHRQHFQFHINPSWGRGGQGRYPRFSFINLIANTGASEQNLNKTAGKRKLFGIFGQRSAPRFTKVLDYPRVDATPQTYGSDGGYGT